jgi:hemerythrin-like metal-binding protein
MTMARIEWQEAFATGIKTIDEQHRKLIEMINRLDAAVHSPDLPHVIGQVLTELVEYARVHFADEERTMDKVGFADTARHKALHVAITKQIVKILLQLRDGQAINIYELISFFKGWLINHIMVEDKAIGRAAAKTTAAPAMASKS